MGLRRLGAVVAVVGGLVPLLGLSACSASSSAPTYYVSLGDSYAIGYQPSPAPGATGGFTAVVSAATHMTLANFGCAGATSSSILTARGCALPATRNQVSYPNQSQASAAKAFLGVHRGHVGLITISIGGNDITNCAARANPVACVTATLPVLEANVTTLATGLRAAAGSTVPIIGLTYPDVLLGQWVYPPGTSNQGVASLSVTAFKASINPALSTAYAKASATFVDITAATGAYTPLAQTTTLAPYGTVPVAVARVCNLTWYCTLGDIHATTPGYTFIGEQIVAAFHTMAGA